MEVVKILIPGCHPQSFLSSTAENVNDQPCFRLSAWCHLSFSFRWVGSLDFIPVTIVLSNVTVNYVSLKVSFHKRLWYFSRLMKQQCFWFKNTKCCFLAQSFLLFQIYCSLNKRLTQQIIKGGDQNTFIHTLSHSNNKV